MDLQIPKNYAETMLTIIKASSQRGAFIPEEFKVVGEVYDFIQKKIKDSEPVVENTIQEETNQ